MSKLAGAAALAVALTMMTTSAVAAVPRAVDDAPNEQGAKTAGQERGSKCATRAEYKRIRVKGKKRSTLRKVRKIIGSNGKRERISHVKGHKWEIRKYRHCGSKVTHVYVNYRDNRA